MKISAKLENSFELNKMTIQSNEVVQEVLIPSKTNGFGSSVNGGELLMLSLATCFCNDIYREAEKKRINVTHVSVEVSSEFISEGKPAINITYSAELKGDASIDELKDLVVHTDKVAEIQNTLRAGVSVHLKSN
jgi:uncharacterized OsmC-like protein